VQTTSRLADVTPFVTGAIIIVPLLLYGFSETFNVSNVLIIGVSILAGILGGYIIYLDHRKSKYRDEMRLLRSVAERWALKGLALAYGVGLATAVLAAVTIESRELPLVFIRGPGGESPAVENGWLLSQSSEYWYVVASQAKVSGPKKEEGRRWSENGADEFAVYPEKFCLLSSRSDLKQSACSVQPTATATATVTATATATSTASSTPTGSSDPQGGDDQQGGNSKPTRQPASNETMTCLDKKAVICAVPSHAIGEVVVIE
jgi:hypothetical protein